MLRERAVRLLDGAGALEILLRSKTSLAPHWLPVLNYHRVHPDADGQAFDRGVIDATPEEFEQQVSLIARYFTPIGVNRLADYTSGGEALPERPALITFDDGYRECLTRALPILRAHGVRASFFIPTQYVSDRRVFWWDRVNYLVRQAKAGPLDLEYPNRLRLTLDGDRRGVIRVLLGTIKSSYDLDIERFLGELGARAGVAWDSDLERKFADELVLAWDDVRALRRAGMEIHSHTRTHRVLQNLRPAELASEISGSRNDLEREIGTLPRAIAYPVGRSIAKEPHIAREIRAAGYELGFTMGVRRFGSASEPFDIGRIAPDRGMTTSVFRALLVHPMLAVG